MMTVTGPTTREHAEARASFYRSRGYAVEIIEDQRLGTPFILRCTERPQFTKLVPTRAGHLVTDSDDDYFERRRKVAAAAKAAGHVGPAVPLDPHS